MDKKEQVGFESRLIELRKRLLRKVDSAEEAMREDVVKPGDISSLPTDPADGDVEGLDAEIAIAQNEELLLEQVEAALERIRVGTYGVCPQCGAMIAARAPAGCAVCVLLPGVCRAYQDQIEKPVHGEPRRFR